MWFLFCFFYLCTLQASASFSGRYINKSYQKTENIWEKVEQMAAEAMAAERRERSQEEKMHDFLNLLNDLKTHSIQMDQKFYQLNKLNYHTVVADLLKKLYILNNSKTHHKEYQYGNQKLREWLDSLDAVTLGSILADVIHRDKGSENWKWVFSYLEHVKKEEEKKINDFYKIYEELFINILSELILNSRLYVQDNEKIVDFAKWVKSISIDGAFKSFEKALCWLDVHPITLLQKLLKDVFNEKEIIRLKVKYVFDQIFSYGSFLSIRDKEKIQALVGEENRGIIYWKAFKKCLKKRPPLKEFVYEDISFQDIKSLDDGQLSEEGRSMIKKIFENMTWLLLQLREDEVFFAKAINDLEKSPLCNLFKIHVAEKFFFKDFQDAPSKGGDLEVSIHHHRNVAKNRKEMISHFVEKFFDQFPQSQGEKFFEKMKEMENHLLDMDKKFKIFYHKNFERKSLKELLGEASSRVLPSPGFNALKGTEFAPISGISRATPAIKSSVVNKNPPAIKSSVVTKNPPAIKGTDVSQGSSFALRSSPLLPSTIPPSIPRGGKMPFFKNVSSLETASSSLFPLGKISLVKKVEDDAFYVPDQQVIQKTMEEFCFFWKKHSSLLERSRILLILKNETLNMKKEHREFLQKIFVKLSVKSSSRSSSPLSLMADFQEEFWRELANSLKESEEAVQHRWRVSIERVRNGYQVRKQVKKSI